MIKKLAATFALLSSPLATVMASSGMPAIVFFLFAPDIVTSIILAALISVLTGNLILAF